MAPKSQGKEIESSSDGGSRKQAAPKNHDITFSTPKQRNRHKSLLSKPLHPCRYPNNYDMIKLGIRDNEGVKVEVPSCCACLACLFSLLVLLLFLRAVLSISGSYLKSCGRIVPRIQEFKDLTKEN